MKKLIALILILLMCMSLFAACGGNEESPDTSKPADAPAPADTSESAEEPAKAPADTITFRFAHNNTEDSSIGQAALKFKELVEEKSNGTLIIEVYPNAQLGDEDTLLESIAVGIVDFAALSTGMMAKVVPDFQVFTLPYAFTSIEKMHELTDGELGSALVDLSAESGIKVFHTFWTDGERYYFNNVRPVYTPADLVGLQLRVPDQPAYILPTQLLGATPVAMAFSETYLACSSGMIDGLETIAAQAVTSNFNEVCKYMCLDGHIMNPSVMTMNLAKFDSLNPEQQAIIEEAAVETGLFQREVAANLAAEAIGLLEDRGMIITEVDKAAFMEAVAPAFDELAATIDPDLVAMVTDGRE